MRCSTHTECSCKFTLHLCGKESELLACEWNETDMEHESAGQELVKCVLVGDTAAGKTRLVCARACNTRTSLRQLLTTHVPTVWAIDQYRMYKEVLERSMSIVDGVQISLRLWDTFGDHEKDRRFAYGRSDVILLCFSTGSRSSLMHCKNMWYPEIRRFCPDTPVLLVGCKNDLRFLVRDPTYLEFCRDRSPFIRPTREGDIVMPEQARAVAKEIGIPYYETSVYTYYGIQQVFENAIRAALISRRSQRFWMTNLKHVQQPLLQAPYCPPKKELNNVKVFPGDFWADINNMLSFQDFPDLVFTIGNNELTAHRVVVAAGARNLIEYLEPEDYLCCRRNSGISTESRSTVDETECLLGKAKCLPDDGADNAAFISSSDSESKLSIPGSCAAVESVKTRTSADNLGTIQIVVELRDPVSFDIMRAHLHFLYTGELPAHFVGSAEKLREVAEILKTPELLRYLGFWVNKNAELMTDKKNAYRKFLKESMWKKCTQQCNTDVTFELDDGSVSAHRAMLMARSDVMRAMFSGDFRERRSHLVAFPGVKTETFTTFLEYIYTDSLRPPVPVETGMLLVELANRLCLPRLVNILETIIINDIAQKQAHGIDVTDEYLRILEPAQCHNADQIAEWCLNQLATNFSKFSLNSKLFKELSSENRQWILQNRWPPVWYVKDFDYYQKALLERYKSESLEKKGRKRNNSGCLCFSGKSRRSTSDMYKPESQTQSYSTV